MRLLSVSIILLLCSSAMLKGQDTLLLMNGKQLSVEIKDDDGARVFFEAKKKKGKLKAFDIHKSDIFSIKKKGEEESILYLQDEDVGYDLSEMDMRYYMAGQNDAREGFATLPTALVGFAIGAGSVFATDGGILPPIAGVFVYSFAMQIPYVHVTESSVSDPKYAVSEYYLEGYDKTARSKKMVHSLLATFAGVVTGWAIYEVGK